MATSKPHRIVVGVDYSEQGDVALDYALDVGTRQEDTEVHVLNVVTLVAPPVTPTMEYAPGAEITGISYQEAKDQLTQYLERKLLRIREQLDTGGQGHFPRVVPHLRVEVPAREIAQLAADLEADLVVVGTHGRRGLSRVLLGSVAESVVRLAPCPVLVVRAKRLVTVATIEPPCPECVKTREATQGAELWCEQHRQRHGQRHTYHSEDRVSKDGTMPLVYHP